MENKSNLLLKLIIPSGQFWRKSGFPSSTFKIFERYTPKGNERREWRIFLINFHTYWLIYKTKTIKEKQKWNLPRNGTQGGFIDFNFSFNIMWWASCVSSLTSCNAWYFLGDFVCNSWKKLDSYQAIWKFIGRSWCFILKFVEMICQFHRH